MENYFGSQQHWEDNINADYDAREQQDNEQIDDRIQPDDRIQCPITLETCDGELICDIEIENFLANNCC